MQSKIAKTKNQRRNRSLSDQFWFDCKRNQNEFFLIKRLVSFRRSFVTFFVFVFFRLDEWKSGSMCHSIWGGEKTTMVMVMVKKWIYDRVNIGKHEYWIGELNQPFLSFEASSFFATCFAFGQVGKRWTPNRKTEKKRNRQQMELKNERMCEGKKRNDFNVIHDSTQYDSCPRCIGQRMQVDRDWRVQSRKMGD